jgi:hypothetical protein
MAILHVQTIGSATDNQGASYTITPTSATVLGNAVIVYVVYYPPSGTYPTCTITDTAGNAYSVLYTVTGSTTTGPSLLIAISITTSAITTSNNITATFTGTAPYSVMIADEWNGINTALDGSIVAASGGAGTSIPFGPLATTNSTDLVLIVIATFGNLRATTWSAGWLGTEFQTASPSLSIAWQLPTSTGSFSGTATIGASEYWNYALFALKGTSTSPSNTPQNFFALF